MSLLDTTREFASAWKFMWATPKRRLLVLAPVGINLALWIGVAPLAYLFARWLSSVSLPDAGWATILSMLAGFFAVLAVVILAVFAFVVLTAVIGAPFYGALAEEAMRDANMIFSEIPWYQEVARALVLTLKLGVVFVFLQVGLLVFNIIPVLGTLLHFVGAFSVAILLLSMEFFGEAFAKDGLSFRSQMRFLLRHHRSLLAFAVPVFVLLLVPGFNLFVPPLAVVTGTRLYVNMRGKKL